MPTIDPQFKKLIPPLQTEEFQQLEQNIINDGCRDAIVLWNDTIIDGHNRYEICTRHNLPFNTTFLDFDSHDDVVLWIIRNQFGRRNLSNYQRSILALQVEDVIAKKAKVNMSLGGASYSPKEGVQNSANLPKPIETRKELATLAGVSHDTIMRVKTIEREAPEETKEALRRGDVSINAVYQELQREEKIAKQKATLLHREIIAKNFAQTTAIDGFYHGNCLDLIPTLAPQMVSLLLTDPPYGMAFQSNRRTANPQSDPIKNDETIESAINIFSAMLNAVSPTMRLDCQVLVFCNWRYEHLFAQAIETFGYSVDASLVWVKENHSSGDLTSFAPKHERILYARRGHIGINPRIPDVLEYARQHDSDHPTEKPVALLSRLIEVTTRPNEVVLDPFSGSGSTGVACDLINRKFVCIEMEEKWHNTAIARIAKKTSV